MDVVISKAKSFQGELTVPGDKSIGHRALMVAALGAGRSEIRNTPSSADLQSTIACLRSLGVECEQRATVVSIQGRGLHGLRKSDSPLDAGNSGTTIRLLSGIVSGQPFESTLFGDESLQKRPMRRIIEPLSRMGARIKSTPHGTAPLRIHGRFPLEPIVYELPMASAQVKSAVLLAGLYADGETTVLERRPSRDHTERMLALPVKTQNGMRTITIRGGQVPSSLSLQIPGDISAAAYLVAAALLVPGSQLMLKHVGLNPSRTLVLEMFRRLGGNITVSESGQEGGEPVGEIDISSSALAGSLSLGEEQVPHLIDEIPVLAATCAAAGCGFEIRGAAELRHKESDRIALLVKNLRSLGLQPEEYNDGFAFQGKKTVFGARIDSGGDHRIAMAFAIAGLASRGDMVVSRAEATDVSFPGFWKVFSRFTSS